MRRQVGIFGLLFFALAATQPVPGQIPGLSSSSPSAAKNAIEPDPLGRDTPHGCVVGFLKAAEREEYGRAAEYLDIKASPRALERARQLQAILNAIRVGGLDTLSRTPEGDLEDGLPASRERVGTLNTADGKFDILLDRAQSGGRPPIWLFSSETLRGVPDAFEQVDVPGIEDYIPQKLREIRVFSLPLYRWLGTLLGIVIALGLASLGSRLLFPLLRPLLRRVTHEQDERRLDALRAPLWPLLLALGLRILAGLTVTVLGRQLWIQSAAAMAVVGFTWLAIRISDVVAGRAASRLTKSGSANKLAILSLLHRLSKVGAGIAGVVVIIYVAGGDVTAILAGVGVGGIVIALAAQKTFENLFGGVSLISDEPIRVGDFCRFADKFGTVEDIGLRSARIRTLDRTILSIPNGQLSLMTLENFTLRDKFLFHHKIGLRYETTPGQMRCVLTQIREMLRGHPKVDQEDARVRMIEFADSAFTVEVFTYLFVQEYNNFLETQEELLLIILDIIVAAGSGVAFPSRTLYVTRDKPHDPALVEQAADRVRQRGGQVLPVTAGDSNGAP